MERVGRNEALTPPLAGPFRGSPSIAVGLGADFHRSDPFIHYELRELKCSWGGLSVSLLAVNDFDEKAAARILGISPKTLGRWRKAGMVSHYRTPTGRIRYTTDHLLSLQRAGHMPASR